MPKNLNGWLKMGLAVVIIIAVAKRIPTLRDYV